MKDAPLTKRERMEMERTLMPEQDATARSHSFTEVNLGFTAEMAEREAMRCLECRRAPCVDGCPVGVNIREFITLVAEGDLPGAAEVIRRDNLLPAICGRVCPQENQCEGACVLAKKDKAIAIGHLERYVADQARSAGLRPPVAEPEPSGHRVAIVGSGPAGLACAADLAKAGHAVTVFEALHEPGGVLVYGIPEYRLPRAVVASEIEGLVQLGVRFESNVIVGRTYRLEELLGPGGFEAVFIGVGAGLPRFLDIPGENLIGVYSANEFLTRVNLMRAYLEDAETPVLDVAGKRVAVFGGGNTAMDAVRTARRLGAAEARIVYRRSADQMPARIEEARHAREEGVEFDFLAGPVELFGTEDGWLSGMRLQRMVLGDPDEDGRRRPQAVAGEFYERPIDLAIIAVGNAPNPLLLSTVPDLARTKRGTLVVDGAGRTSMPGVFAGGDIVTGGATVILAMGAGRSAARAITDWLESGDWIGPGVAVDAAPVG